MSVDEVFVSLGLLRLDVGGRETRRFFYNFATGSWVGAVANKDGCASSRYGLKRRWMALSKDNVYLLPADKE